MRNGITGFRETQNGSSVISLDRIQRLRAVEGAAAACTISNFHIMSYNCHGLEQPIKSGESLGFNPDRYIYIIKYVRYDCEKPVIIGHNRSSNPLGDLKTRVGWDQSVICPRPIGQIGRGQCVFLLLVFLTNPDASARRGSLRHAHQRHSLWHSRRQLQLHPGHNNDPRRRGIGNGSRSRRR